MRRTLLILTVAILIGLANAKAAQAQQHDHQQWNLSSIGRLITFARTNRCVEEKTPGFGCGVEASHSAAAKMDELLEMLGCKAVGDDVIPTITPALPLSRHDYGPVIVAELRDVRCATLPSTQLVPVDPQIFKERCSRVEWKCDTVWIPDSDPSLWYMGVLNDIPRNPS